MGDKKKHMTKMDQLIAKTWVDDAFKAQLIKHPVATPKAEGIEVPEGVTINVLENTEQVSYLVLPHGSSELTDEALENVVGGLVMVAPPQATDSP